MALGGVVSYPTFVTHDGATCVLTEPMPGELEHYAELKAEADYAHAFRYVIGTERPDVPINECTRLNDCNDISPNSPGDGRIIRKRIP